MKREDEGKGGRGGVLDRVDFRQHCGVGFLEGKLGGVGGRKAGRRGPNTPDEQ